MKLPVIFLECETDETRGQGKKSVSSTRLGYVEFRISSA